MQEKTSMPIPMVLRELIMSNNTLLKQYQHELTQKVVTANMEMMTLLGLDPKEGWVLDLDNMVYTKQEPTQNNDT